ncbi:MAG: hypothetical protein WAO71_09825 [Gallionella sp.]
MDVYNSKYLHIAFFAGQLLLEATWLSESKMMNTEECKQEFLNYRDVVLKRRPMRVIVDTSNMLFTLAPTIQDWINQNIFPSLLNVGVKRTAFVISKDFFAQLSTKQVLTEIESRKLTGHFDTKDAAKKWVLSL